MWSGTNNEGPFNCNDNGFAGVGLGVGWHQDRGGRNEGHGAGIRL